MPILSMFYGIIIRMYFMDDRQHYVPHVHAECAGSRAVFSIVSGELIASELPTAKPDGCRRGLRFTVKNSWPVDLSYDTLYLESQPVEAEQEAAAFA